MSFEFYVCLISTCFCSWFWVFHLMKFRLVQSSLSSEVHGFAGAFCFKVLPVSLNWENQEWIILSIGASFSIHTSQIKFSRNKGVELGIPYDACAFCWLDDAIILTGGHIIMPLSWWANTVSCWTFHNKSHNCATKYEPYHTVTSKIQWMLHN